ncbi:hypothetical protein OE88DRAFT_1632347 [Heliocybe sulcata]|uniref:Uncharacterized protein n=1 Tax=Heliocybe sulcata TaxID=5364 RepID=A0A5C3MXH8_9AGAM|nr:hypothetical protein OE88DRAFT_1632347 [Heliocybe sulcata]
MPSSLAFGILAAFVSVLATGISAGPTGSLVQRASANPLTLSCYLGGPATCECPIDARGVPGILVNVFPGYQCAYATGACSWSDITGALQNTAQGNCPRIAPCPASGCTCPEDLNGDQGALINRFSGYQCAYINAGICTYDSVGVPYVIR